LRTRMLTVSKHNSFALWITTSEINPIAAPLTRGSVCKFYQNLVVTCPFPPLPLLALFPLLSFLKYVIPLKSSKYHYKIRMMHRKDIIGNQRIDARTNFRDAELAQNRLQLFRNLGLDRRQKIVQYHISYYVGNSQFIQMRVRHSYLGN
jgi:hypothetical protein